MTAFPHPSGPSPDEIAKEWLAHLRNGSRRRTALTVYQYAGKLQSFLRFIGDTPLEYVSMQDIERWLSRPRRGGGTGEPATVSKEVSILSGFFAFAVTQGYLQADPTALLEAPKVKNEHPNPVPDDVWVQQWECESLSTEARALLGLGYFCGLRRVEIVSLMPEHFDVRRQRIVKFTRKGGGDDVLDYGELASLVADELPMLAQGGPERFTDALHEQVRAARKVGRLFAWGDDAIATRRLHSMPSNTTDPQLIYRRLRRWQAQAGLEEGVYSPHMLRHAFVTNLLRCGVPIHLVSKLANHSNLSTTMRYAKVSGADLRDWRRREQALRSSSYNRWED